MVVYGLNNASCIIQLWDELAGLWSICIDRWCVIGDFNVVRFVHEKFYSTRNTRSMKIFKDLIGELSLFDQPLKNSQYTWSNFKDLPICFCLDRFLFFAG